MIETTLGWTVHSRSWLRHIEDQLSDKQKGVRDEIGVLAIHSAFADRFFPGTSVQQTRLRYVLFVPWIYQWLGEQDQGPEFRAALANTEVRLVEQLARSESRGVIGERIYPRPSVQPPSVIYWTAIRTWGLLRRWGGGFPSRSGVHQLLAYGQQALALRDDDGEPLDRDFKPFYSDIPGPPSEFLDRSRPLDFRLTPEEQSYLGTKLGSVTQHDDQRLTLLARLSDTPEAAVDAKEPWDPRIEQVADEEDRKALVIARRASHLAGIVRAAYAALVEQVRDEEDGLASERRHRDRLEAVLTESARQATALDLDALSQYMPGWKQDGLFRVLEATQEWVRGGAGALGDLRDPYATQEAARKGSRARLPLTAAAAERRIEWDFTLQQRLDYRWPHVRVFLEDLSADV